MDTEHVLTVPLARQLLLTSFWLSQGSYPLQALLFGAVHLHHPAWHLSAEMVQALESLAAPITVLLARGGHAPQRADEVAKELQRQIRNLEAELGGAPVVDPSARAETLAALLRHFIARDHHYLCEEGTRPRQRREAGALSWRHDPQFSFCCHYLFLKQACGCQVFDTLLEDLRQVCAGQRADARSILALALTDEPTLSGQLAEVVATYLHAHPTAPLVLSACLAPLRHARSDAEAARRAVPEG